MALLMVVVMVMMVMFKRWRCHVAVASTMDDTDDVVASDMDEEDDVIQDKLFPW